jgi:hypothetical protein
MGLRALLAALIVVSTGAFVVGTTLERRHKHKERPATETTVTRTTVTHKATLKTTATRPPDAHAGESAAHRAAEGLPPETKAPKATRTVTSKTTTTVVTTPDAHAGESAAHRAAEGAHPETHAELKPLGVDIEAVPFVALAAVVSLGLGVAAWLRPRRLPLLLFVAATMLAFALLDVREVFHQRDESQTALAVLAGVVAALHLGAASVAGVMSRNARRPLA